MKRLSPELQADVAAIERIPVITKILEVICRTTGMGFAAVARVTEDKWVACSLRDELKLGLMPGDELNLEYTICNQIRQNGKAVIIEHLSEDEDFCDHYGLLKYGFQSYISIPIYRKNGSFFGTLCAVDPKPILLKNSQTIDIFNLYSDLIAFHLSGIEQVDFAEMQLLEERKALKLREQFIAILGHDLRNPLGAISSSIQMMLRSPLDGKLMRLAEIIKSSSSRMKELIENVLDFARAEQGSGIALNIKENEPVQEILEEVIAELQIIWPKRKIEFKAELQGPVTCDTRRIAQLFSNLLGNALTHGDAETPVYIEAFSNLDGFELSVTNKGNPIPKDQISRLFKPYVRGEGETGKEGLGLGLYISSEIARAHGGEIKVRSNKKETCFSLKISC